MLHQQLRVTTYHSSAAANDCQYAATDGACVLVLRAAGLDFSLFRLDWWNLRLKALAERKKPTKAIDATSGKNVGVSASHLKRSVY
jgi:hypothetical protein